MKKTLQFAALATAFSLVSATASAQDPTIDPPNLNPPTTQGQDATNRLVDPPALQDNRPADQQQQATDDRPRMGVMLGQSAGAGVLITDVMPGGPAYNAGLRRGDYIISVGSQKVSDPNTVIDVVGQEVVDDRVKLKIWRDAQAQDWEVDLRNTGPAANMQADPRMNANAGQTYRSDQYYNNGQYYNPGYNRTFSNNYYYNDPYRGYRNSYPYYGTAGPRDYYYNPGWRDYNNRYSTGYRGLYGNGYYGNGYYGNGLYLNGGGRGGLQIGGFGINW